MARPADCFPRSRCQTYRRCSDLDRQERDPDMSVQPRHSLLTTRTMFAAFLVFAAIVLIPQVAAAQSTTICHIPPGSTANAHTITVGSLNAVVTHTTQHGDFLGPCVCSPDTSLCGPNFAPCCPGTQCVPSPSGTSATCQTATSSNPLPPGGECTDSSQCDALHPCTSIGTNDSVCGG